MAKDILKLTISDIMHRNVITVQEDVTILDAVRQMEVNNIGAVMVINTNKEIMGIFSERDVFSRVVAREKNPLLTHVSDVMTKYPKRLRSDMSVSEAYKLTQSGKFRHVPIVDDGDLVGIVSVRDINKAFYEEKEAVNELKTKFAMISSHELRTPCAIMQMCASLLKTESGKSSEQRKHVLGLMEKNIHRLEKILNNITLLYSGNFSSIESRLTLSSIEDIIRNTMDDIAPFIAQRQQNLSVEMGKSIPEIKILRNGIKNVLENILLNAIRFTPDKGNIIIRVKNEENDIRVEVEDTGIGIPEDKLDRIFESFYEVSDTKHHSSGNVEFRSGGAGLGLTIAKNIIDAHKGNIWAESEIDKFSRFIFTIPKH